jgi:hypothetical protein
MRYIPFHPDHFLAIDFVKEESFICSAMMDPAARRQWFYPTLSYTAVEDGKIYGAFGIVPLAHGRGLAWAVFDRNISPKRFTTVAKRAKFMMEEMFNLHFFRLEAYIQPGYEQAHRLAKVFKFEKEGRMRKFDGINDYDLYARVKWQ